MTPCPAPAPARTLGMCIRPVVPADGPLMQRFLLELSDAARRHRFHGAVNACSSGLLRLMTCADGTRHVAWVVVTLDADGQRLLGEARFVVDADGREAEIAMAVADDCCGRGIADRLVRTLMAAAAARGVRRLRAEVELSNRRMRDFVRRHGFLDEAAPCFDSEAGLLRFACAVPDLRLAGYLQPDPASWRGLWHPAATDRRTGGSVM